ncbi:hypothetical protein GDO78_001910 [Eleutherodactylus coqui]|uniref:DUF4371 domain-containing protein n=1 Tax=Eleutherodactylus coqui TaxID=57060 RepID=A0A8J6FVJ4_ELECQ|nr:hypothetical protein GDO78_001910 [Eleutherodactylus coqui]
MAEKKKCCQYSNEYLEYVFIPSPTNGQRPLFLVCEKAFLNEAMKPSRRSDHLAKMHSDKVGKPISFFQGLKSKFENCSTVGKIFGKSALSADKGLLASSKVSVLIAQCGKPHTIGETLVLPAVKGIASTILGPDACAMVKSIPLSNNTVSRRIDEMAADIDESMVRDNEALLLAYIRFINWNEEVVEELLFTRNLTTDTKGSSIYRRVEEFFQEIDIPLTNVLACATDGAASMIGRYCRFIAHFKSAIPGIGRVHCVVHQQHLLAKHLYERLHVFLPYVINAVNKIKVHSFNERLFRKLCQDHDEEFKRPLLHTEVSLCDAIELRCLDVAYLADIFDKLNEVNIKLQGEKRNLIIEEIGRSARCATPGIISSFIAKLDLHTNNLSQRDLCQFLSLQNIVCEDEEQTSRCILRLFCSHLKQAKEDMQTRFYDLYTLEIPMWVLNPFSADAGEFHPKLQEQLYDLKHDSEAQALFQLCGNKCFSVKVKNSYPMAGTFPSTYLVERGFSAVQQLLTKARNRLQICVRGDLRLQLTKIEPDIAKLVSAYQAQGRR